MMTEPVCLGCRSLRIATEGKISLCLDCGLRMATDTSIMDYGAAYRDDVSLYAEHFRALDRFQTAADIDTLLLPFERRIVERLGAQHSGSLVDLGCGTGRFLRAAEVAGVNAVGFEIADVLVERLTAHGRNVRAGDIDAFLESDLKPDAVSLLEVVEHLPDPFDAIEKLVLKKQPKYVYVVVPDWATRRHYDSRFAGHDVPPNHLTWWAERSLAALLGRHGYKVEVEAVPETRRSLLGHLARNRQNPPPATVAEWTKAFVSPPTFWLLGIAQRH